MVFVDPATIATLPLTHSAEIALTEFLPSDLYRDLYRELSNP